MDYVQEIKKLAKEKNAIILAHNYQNEEIQDIAHETGDSLELARIAAGNDADILVFCGVHFMAESAKILSPEKKVILPDPTAGCPMAEMATAEQLRNMRAKYPDAKVVTYINSTAEVKALSDVTCTSSNAVKIVQRIDADRIIFVPDKNLGTYVQQFTDKEIILWDGYCPTHNAFTLEQLHHIRKLNPGADVVVHPECRPEVAAEADEVLSTGQMVTYAENKKHGSIIICTEKGMVHKMKSVNSDINYIFASDDFICPDMKKITLEKLYDALNYEKTLIQVDSRVREGAAQALNRMLELS